MGDWKDNNLQMFGGDVEKKIKAAAALGEPEWDIVGKTTKPRLFIWRIEKYKVKEWPHDQYGKFYNGDSYIILNIWQEKNSPALNYDVHFWIGGKSTQDEYTTAAYKTVELDMYLQDAAIQHREVEAHESDLFKGYFPSITIMKGGCESGFNHVKPEAYPPRLLHFSGIGKKIEVREVPAAPSSLDKSDVFILDLGLEIIQWNGETSNKDERFKAMEYTQNLKKERAGRPVITVTDSTQLGESKFYKSLRDEASGLRVKKEQEAAKPKHAALFRLSDQTGELKCEKLDEGDDVDEGLLTDEDVFIVDSGKLCLVYIGERASHDEKKNAMAYAHKYLMKTDHPLVPIMALRGDRLASQASELKEIIHKKK
jgi:gelsolin